MATTKSPTKAAAPAVPPLAQELLYALRYWLRQPRVFIPAAAVVAGAGLYSGWGWLAAAGLLPIVLMALPCAAMCAVGLCAMGKGDKSGTKQASAEDATTTQPLSRANVEDWYPRDPRDPRGPKSNA
ncbi:MAG: hypothetical protein ACT4P2_10335 [Pseudomonadota bacterium]